MNANAKEPGASRWSLSLGRAFGIPIRLHATFIVVVAFMAMNALYAFARGVVAWDALLELSLVFLLFGSVVLHELGHALVARRYGIRTQEIVLYPIGGVARVDSIPQEPTHEIAIAAAGPLVSFALGGAALLALAVMGAPLSLSTLEVVREGRAVSDAEALVASVATMNIVLGAFNLLPAFPMDGGRVLRAVLATRMAHTRATIIAGRVGQVFAFFLGLAGLFLSPMLVVVAFFVFLGASAEMKDAEVAAVLAGRPARAGMMRDFHVLHTSQRLADAVTATLHGAQRDFPVVDDSGAPHGILTYERLLHGLAALGPEGLVTAAMQPDALIVEEDEPLADVLRKMRERSTRVAVVVDASTSAARPAVGLVVPENVAELVEIMHASTPSPSRVRAARAA